MMDIEAFLKRTGLNQSRLAEALGVKSSSITKWKAGGGIDVRYLDHLLRLGMRIDEAFSPEAWDAVKRTHADEFRDAVLLSPEECARIVMSGMQKMKEQGQEIVALRKVQGPAGKD